MSDTYEERFEARTWDVDEADRLTMAAAYNYCQEAAGRHAALLGVGKEYMASNGIAWILSRMSAELEERPRFGSTVTVRTWPRGTERLFAVRDYELLDESGSRLGRGRSAWLIVDTSTYRPRRPETLAAGLPVNAGRDALPDGAIAIPAAEGLSPSYSRRVAYSDLDYNGHVNNARYAQWAQDALEPAWLSSARSLRLDVNYLAELRPGQAADIFAGPCPPGQGWEGGMTIEGRLPKPDGGFQASFRAVFSKRD